MGRDMFVPNCCDFSTLHLIVQENRILFRGLAVAIFESSAIEFLESISFLIPV